MNKVELNEALNGNSKWAHFAEKLEKAMTEEFNLEDVTVVLRELTAEEKLNKEHEVLLYSHVRQQFEFAMSGEDRFPAPWKIADRIEHFLHPDIEE